MSNIVTDYATFSVIDYKNEEPLTTAGVISSYNLPFTPLIFPSKNIRDYPPQRAYNLTTQKLPLILATVQQAVVYLVHISSQRPENITLR